jgi:hypothetical protein
LHAGTRIYEHDREGLQPLCRYAVRPPFALHRLSAGPEGRLVYRMKRPRGGSLFLLLTPDELLSRIATLVPPPRSHAPRYHGLFAPNAKHRGRVVPSPAPPAQPSDPCHPPAPPSPASKNRPPSSSQPFQLTPPVSGPPGRPAPRYRVPWSELLRKVFAIDVLECPRCGGRLELIAIISEPGVAKRILDHLGLASQAPPLARARAADDLARGHDGPNYHAGDPSYDE